MTPYVELHLATLLLLPWYAVVAWAFWRMVTRGAPATRKFAALGVPLAAIFAELGRLVTPTHRADRCGSRFSRAWLATELFSVSS